MTIDSELYRTTGVGNDSTTSFPYTFEIADESEIEVVLITMIVTGKHYLSSS